MASPDQPITFIDEDDDAQHEMDTDNTYGACHSQICSNGNEDGAFSLSDTVDISGVTGRCRCTCPVSMTTEENQHPCLSVSCNNRKASSSIYYSATSNLSETNCHMDIGGQISADELHCENNFTDVGVGDHSENSEPCVVDNKGRRNNNGSSNSAKFDASTGKRSAERFNVTTEEDRRMSGIPISKASTQTDILSDMDSAEMMEISNTSSFPSSESYPEYDIGPNSLPSSTFSSSSELSNSSMASSLSSRRGLSGHLMDYYLTMVFPGQPGSSLDNIESGAICFPPLGPIFQIGEELIKKSPVSVQDEFDSEERKIIVGICAMEKKTQSKPMSAILERLAWFEYIETLIFEENVILHEPVEAWPLCAVFISFHSKGFPLNKAIQYVNLRQPIIVNDLEMQFTLQDRREVHRILEREGIPQPRYMVVNRDNSASPSHPDDSFTPHISSSLIELEDSVELDGEVFHKPFVEKPVSAEDHNVYIYFPTAAGGGSQRLFRKVGSRSSIYSNCTKVRKTGSYIYEDFMPTDGTDVKVYTVGPDYAHAEARKSPALDGKVERDQNGKEVRYPVILSSDEKMIARKVTLAFKQTVCGFDLLRANGKSLVCDVNGFSFVKTSSKYYDDCAKVLGTMIMRALAPQLHIPWVLGSAPEDIPVVPTTSGTMMELRCVTAVIRHGDRTPKQKMKMEVKQRRFFELFQKYDGYKTGQLKLKQPKQLQEVLDIVRFLLQEHQVNPDPEIEEKKAKLEQLKLVLEMYGYFSGINRKVQLKYQPHGRPKRSSSEDAVHEDLSCNNSTVIMDDRRLARYPSYLYEFTGIHRKVQLKDQPYSNTDASASSETEDEAPPEPSLLLIVKWGGELTPAGKTQAEQLGKAFRSLYPGGQGEYGAPGLGILRLHSTYRHDLKIYASDEGRVQMTAAAFAKGLLALEGELPPILVQMVKCANTNGLLDSEGETSKYQHVVKEKLKHILNQNRDFTELDYVKLAPTNSQSLLKAIKFINNPFHMCERVHAMLREITSKVRRLKIDLKHEEKKLYHGETWDLLLRRWAKLEKDFKMKNGWFDINKIPDIYDCIKYDLQHNQTILQFEKAEELYACSKALADLVIPQEYGISKEEKLHIAQSYCTPLLRKIRSDLSQVLSQDQEDDITRLDSRYSKGVATPHRFVRTRLYFTSESHIHSLLTMLRYGGLLDELKDEQWKRAMDYVNDTAELNYMTQIVVMMYEDPSKEYSSDERFHVELHFSPGAYTCDSDRAKAQNSAGQTAQGSKLHPSPGLHQFGPRTPLHILSRMSHQAKTPTLGLSSSTDEIEKSNAIFDAIFEEQEKMYKSQRAPPRPQSPDQNVPEWDWGDEEKTLIGGDTEDERRSDTVTPQPSEECLGMDDQDSSSTLGSGKEEGPSEDSGDHGNVEQASTNQKANLSKGKTPSRPISISKDKPSIRVSDSDQSRPQSFEEKRSQSFEDKSEGTKEAPLVERHYLTVQLPLVDHKKHRHSFTNLFTVPDMSCGMAESFRETFTMVPSIQPLETLYNSLTLKQLDNFLDRITNIKFMTPSSTPPSHLMSPLQGGSPHAGFPPLGVPFTAYSVSSSANSSPGPSSPVSTPEDIMTKLKVFMERQHSGEATVASSPYKNPHLSTYSKNP